MVLTLVCGQAYVTALFVLETCRHLHRSHTTINTTNNNDNHQPSQPPPPQSIPTNTVLHHQDTPMTCPIVEEDNDNEEEERNDPNGSSTHAPSTAPLMDDHDNDESPSHYELSTLTKLVLGRAAGWFFTITLACDLYVIAWAFCSVFGQAMAQEFPLRHEDDDPTLDDYQIYILCFMVVAIPLSCTNLLDQLILQLAFLATRMVMVTVMIVTLMHAHANPQQTLFAIPNDDDNDKTGRPTQPHDSLGWEWSHLLTVVELAVFSTAFQFCVPHILYLTTTLRIPQPCTTVTTESSPSLPAQETTPNGAMPLPIESVSGTSNAPEPRSLIDEGQPEAESSSSDSTHLPFPQGTLVVAVLFIWGSNLTLSWLQSTYFGPDYTESSSNLNWADYQGTVRVRTASSSSPVGNFVVLFAALDGLAVFPLLALSLGDILHHACCVTPPNHASTSNNSTQQPSMNDLSDEQHPRSQQEQQQDDKRALFHRVWDCLATLVFQRPRIVFRLLASIPPAVAALLVRDLPTLASLGVIFTMLSYTAAPSLLYLAVQRQKHKESEKPAATQSKGDGLQNPSNDLLLDENDTLEPANPNDSGWFDETRILTTIAWTLLVTVVVLIVAILVQFSIDRRNE